MAKVSIYNLAHPTEVREELSVQGATTLCNRLCHKYCGKRKDYSYNRQFPEMIRKCLAYCKVEGIDAKVYLEAQFHTLSLFCKTKNIIVFPSMLMGKNAASRYWKFVKMKRRMFTRGREELEKDERPYLAELFYAECYLKNRLAGKKFPKQEVVDEIREMYGSAWATKRSPEVRNRVLCKVLDEYGEGMSDWVYAKTRKWNWADVADFLETVIPELQEDRITQDEIESDEELGIVL